jgi:nucleoside-diphosphate-sugar epimerase
VHVIGATGRTGAVLCRALLDAGNQVVPVVRDADRWRALGLAGTPVVADLAEVPGLARALAGAERVVSVSYAVWTGQVLAAAPAGARLVLVGTARRYGTLEDAEGADAARAEALLLGSGRDGVMLHPTMIYGAPGDGTISRLAGVIRRAPVLPLPGGGRALVQPVHVGDLVAAIVAALELGWTAPGAIPVGGPEPIAYAALIRAIARAAGVRAPLILPVPAAVVRLAGMRRPALLRLLADRTVDVGMMKGLLGVTPRPLAEGLAALFPGGR